MPVAGRALFLLTALRAAAVLPPDMLEPLPHSGSALVALHRAAYAGSNEAALALADRFFTGRGVEPHCHLGLSFALRAAEAVSAEVESEVRYTVVAPPDLRDKWMDAALAGLPDDPDNAPEVVAMDEDMALRGNLDAQRRMAYRRLMGQGVPRDLGGAYADFAAAAAQGDAYAIYNVGFMHLQGMHVAQNSSMARDMFELSAAKNLSAGYNGLGVLYWGGGPSIPRNMTKALEYFRLGAEQGSPDCLFNLGTM